MNELLVYFLSEIRDKLLDENLALRAFEKESVMDTNWTKATENNSKILQELDQLITKFREKK